MEKQEVFIPYAERMKRLGIEEKILATTSLGPHLLNHVRNVSVIVDRIDRGETTLEEQAKAIVKIMDEMSRVRGRAQNYSNGNGR